jgi:hypothetical protein
LSTAVANESVKPGDAGADADWSTAAGVPAPGTGMAWAVPVLARQSVPSPAVTAPAARRHRAMAVRTSSSS